MLYVILLLILAVLLFGSSAVLGVLGIVLGFIAAFIALTMLGVLFSLTPTYIIIIGVVGVAVLVGGFFLFAWIRQPYESEVISHRHDLAQYLGDAPVVRDWRYRLCEKIYGPVESSSLWTP